ncbi:DUF6261 family protein [Capnocytophaga sp. oral taxon 864]|uniref:DUF6261 family protein n=1 Tax=Capnocytophaga sp. oral taxon 864 TaxID=1316593 RepID=UPI000D028A89|nr:DUF6261 family protein [Capnocytophaga sp. oral taxon 864]AVM55325.1 hypothetical protein C3V44_06620 [Capnocytophaga sp. oral taxon 864]
MSFKIDISLPNVSKLNNDEYAQFIKGVVKLVNTTTVEKLGVKPELITAIEKNLDLLTEASRQSRSSKESENINRLDKQRNELLSYLLSSFRLGKKSSLQTQKDSAQILYLEFKNYKGVASLPTRQKSQAIDALVKDLEKPEIAKHLKTLGISHAVVPLKEANAKYQELVDVRAENQISNKVINVKKVRKETDLLYKDLARFVFANHIINASAETDNFTTLFNKLLDDTINANKQRLAQALITKKSTKPTGTKSVSE